MSDPRNLSGVWFGRYDSSVQAETNNFIARIADSDGGVTGVITEPDPRNGSIRRAYLVGTRDGAALGFVKRYDGGPHAYGIRYVGQVNADATEVTGSWTLLGNRGSFVMSREKFDAELIEEEREVELEKTR